MSEIRANTISDAAGTGPVTLTGQSAAKAYACFNGTSTPFFHVSFNCSSLTDLGTGEYNVNFTNSMSVAFSPVSSGVSGSGIVNFLETEVHSYDATFCRYRTFNYNGGLTDGYYNSLSAHGDLA